jgi:hypothetical protein
MEMEKSNLYTDEQLQIIEQFTWEKYETDREYRTKMNAVCGIKEEDRGIKASLIDLVRPYSNLYHEAMTRWQDMMHKEKQKDT